MIEHPERVEQFKRDIAEMQVKDPAAGRDRLAARGGAALMIIGIIVTIVAYAQSHNTSNPRPYSRDILLQGTKGIVRKYPAEQIYVEGKSQK